MLVVKNICRKRISTMGSISDSIIENRSLRKYTYKVLVAELYDSHEHKYQKFYSEKVTYDDYNSNALYQHKKDAVKIIELLLRGYRPRYFNNFIMIGDTTFNGWNRDTLMSLPTQLEEKGYYKISDLEKLKIIMKEEEI